MSNAIFPEFIRQAGNKRGDNEVWDIARCMTMRGAPKTCIATHTIRVPLDADETARCIRAHELMHIRISPKDVTGWVQRKKASLESLMFAEECRVNKVLDIEGFQPHLHLFDPTDETTGYESAKHKDWRTLIKGIAATHGTAGQEDFRNGVKKAALELGDKSMLEGFDCINSQIETILENCSSILTSDRSFDGRKRKVPMTRGFEVTERIAAILDKYIALASETGQMPIPDTRRCDSVDDGRGAFAPLCHGRAPLTKMHNGDMGRIKVCSQSGRSPRRLHRLLTDPYKRIFDRMKRNKGGVVLIDWSGSMSLESSDILKILNAAPGATIAAYAHKDGSKNVPNFWILAKDGKMVDKLPTKNGGGNGVDGPALRWAIAAKRFANEAVVWMCDGGVTSGHDDCGYAHLTAEARALAIKAKAVMTETVEETIEYLKKLTNGATHIGPRLIGPLDC